VNETAGERAGRDGNNEKGPREDLSTIYERIEERIEIISENG